MTKKAAYAAFFVKNIICLKINVLIFNREFRNRLYFMFELIASFSIF
ncbi:hypothetical protein CLV48_10942 [Cecembia rubra]|uniref:Uncharacterized protein n=1 Tax=Cecembia rubra TaxID=1485585 RepID=A0A2P8DZH0_9BACT|nr:hypothetical protein CLV48_10942 [Cecembia rubra]